MTSAVGKERKDESRERERGEMMEKGADCEEKEQIKQGQDRDGYYNRNREATVRHWGNGGKSDGVADNAKKK